MGDGVLCCTAAKGEGARGGVPPERLDLCEELLELVAELPGETRTAAGVVLGAGDAGAVADADAAAKGETSRCGPVVAAGAEEAALCGRGAGTSCLPGCAAAKGDTYACLAGGSWGAAVLVVPSAAVAETSAAAKGEDSRHGPVAAALVLLLGRATNC